VTTRSVHPAFPLSRAYVLSMADIAHPRGRERASCSGCLGMTPSSQCAACGSRASVAYAVGEHSLSLCWACVVLAENIRASNHAADPPVVAIW